MKILLIITLITCSFGAFAQNNDVPVIDGKETTVGNKKVVYVYKQYERLDFDDLSIEGDTGNPGDLSIAPMPERRFANRLPYRKSFTVEIKKGIERVR